MMNIKLAGFIGMQFGAEHEFHVRTPNEAIRALCQRVPGFRAFLTNAHERGIYFQIITSNASDVDDAIGYDDLSLGCQSFTLVPVISGSFFGLFGGGGGGFLQILLGVALVAFAFTGFGFVTWGAAGTISAGIQVATAALGVGLLFSGVSSLFAPGTPTSKNRSESKGADDAISRGASPVAVNGAAVPLLYGTYRVSEQPVVSSYILDNKGYYMALISEGPIEGFASGNTNAGAGGDLFLDGLVASKNLVSNVQLTNGSQTTSAVDIVKSAGFNIAVNSPFNAQGGEFGESDNGLANAQVTRTFNNKEADEVTFRFSVGPCYQTKVKSDSGGSDSSFKHYDSDEGGGRADNPTEIVIEILNGNGDLFLQDTQKFTKETSTRLKEFTYPRPGVDGNIRDVLPPVTLRVTRVDRKGPKSPESDVDDGKSKQWSWTKGSVTWLSADVTWAEKLVYPFSSLLAIKFAAGEFSRMPRVEALLNGLHVPTINSKLKVKYRFSNNPAYVLLDLLTNPRYGAGYRTYTIDGLSQAQAGIRMQDIDLGSFKNAADYCDTNGITFNGYVNRDADALELFRGIASCFQAQVIYAGGFITLVVDKKLEEGSDGSAEHIRIYSAANTISDAQEGEASNHFSYEGTARRARNTAVEVSFVSANEAYTERKCLIESAELIDRYGYNLNKVRALGCTNEAQAKRLGRYMLATNTLSTETVTFKVGPDGAMILPGDLCLVLDPLKLKFKAGGRILATSATTVTLDRDPGTISNPLQTLYTYGKTGVAYAHDISSISGATVTINGRFSSTSRPSTMDMWAIVPGLAAANEHPLYRVQNVKENGDNTFTVIAINYNEQKYDFVEGTGELSVASYTSAFRGSANAAIAPSSINLTLRGATST